MPKSSIKLTERLAALAGMVPPGSVVADIGADHGYLICELVSSGRCPSGFACDINPMPLARARETIRRNDLSLKIEAVLSDGLTALCGRSFDCVVIAGMGGDLIARLVLTAEWARDALFLLQPMTKAERLRAAIFAGGFEILREIAVPENGFIYPILEARYTGCATAADPLLAWTGKMWENTDEASLRYLRRVYRQMSSVYLGLTHTGAPPEERRAFGQALNCLKERLGEG